MFLRILAAILAAVLCFGMLVLAAVAEEGEMSRDEVKEIIYLALTAHEKEIVFKRGQVRADVFFSCVNDIVCDSPFLFYFTGRVDYISDSRGYILSAKPQYSMDHEAARVATEVCLRELSRITLLCPDGASDYEKALFFHDYLCKSFEYDLTLESRNLYSFLSSGTGNCMAYTQTYTALLRMSGVTVGYAASDEMEHIWNVVRLGEAWYHVDLTWDDLPGKRFAQVEHLQFLFSDETAVRLGYSGWRTVGGVKCLSDHKSYSLVSAINGAVEKYRGEYYFCDGGIYKLNFDDLSIELVDGSRGASCVEVCGGRLLYGRGDGIWGLDGERIFSVTQGICGMREGNNMVEYAIIDFASGREVYAEIDLPFGFCGDADSDGEVTPKDLLLFGVYIRGESCEGISFAKKAADMNADGVINEDDLMLMRRRIVAF